MGWGRMFLLGNFGQQMDIDELQSDIRELRFRLSDHAHSKRRGLRRNEQLEAEVAELRLYLASLLRILRGKEVPSAAELQAMAAPTGATTASSRRRAPVVRTLAYPCSASGWPVTLSISRSRLSGSTISGDGESASATGRSSLPSSLWSVSTVSTSHPLDGRIVSLIKVINASSRASRRPLEYPNR